MKDTLSLPADLHCLSLLLSYPDQCWRAAPAPPQSSATAAALLATMRAADPIALQSEYVRLFVNAMPSLPCPPYGSVYLEGSLLGRSTIKIAEHYRKYGLACEEPADHIAVECAFLALLHEFAAGDPEAAADYGFLANHLQQWAERFFALIKQHDRLGLYRQCADFGYAVLAVAGNEATGFTKADDSFGGALDSSS